MNARILNVLNAAALTMGLWWGCDCRAGGDVYTKCDPSGDAVARATDLGGNAPMPPGMVLPDMRGVSVCGWEPFDAVDDPYCGRSAGHDSAHLFRLDIVFDGLVNPPGTTGSGGTLYEPFTYGPSPVFGFIEIDMDDDRQSGGELGTSATTRYLANVGRFGAVPRGSLGERAARSGLDQDFDNDFYSEPYFERSGAEFEVSLCGCFASTIVSQNGDGDSTFEAGETWILRGRFFRRSGGYHDASVVYGGSEPQEYDPWVNLRFSHDEASNQTTITLVWAMDMTGAGLLVGQPPQAIDDRIDINGNQSSIAEAIQDIIDGANGLHGGWLTGPVGTLTNRWRDRSPSRALDIGEWRITALVGTACENPLECTYIWTDAGFNENVADLDTSGVVDASDAMEFDTRLSMLDGGAFDLDGVRNGVVHIRDFAGNFNVMDFNYDGVINATDRAVIVPLCPGDWNKDGYVNTQDFFDFLVAFFEQAPRADINDDGIVNSQDFFDFIVRFFGSC